jgi:transposase
MSRHDLTDAQWHQLAPLLPPQKPRVGRPGHPHRRIVNGILWILATGAPWRDLPAQYGSWHTVASRFYRWRDSGIWARLLAALQRQADRQGQLDWSVHFLDSTIVRAHQHAAGARGGQAAEALGRSRGGFSTKVHVRADRHGKPVVLLVTAGERHDQTMFEPLLEQGQIRRDGRGRPRQRPRRIVGDKGYSSRRIRGWLRRHGIRHTIPHKRNECQCGRFDRALYRERNQVERLINRLKQFRRVATRYEKRATNYAAMITLAAVLVWLGGA